MRSREIFFTDYTGVHEGAKFFQVAEHKIPRLKIIDDMVEISKPLLSTIKGMDLNKTVIIGVQHALETTVTLFDGLINMGLAPENMFFLDKCYSSSPEVISQIKKRKINLMQNTMPNELGSYDAHCRSNLIRMWKDFLFTIKDRNVDRIIILDEGGRCLENMPHYVAFKYRVAAIEQTRGGLYSESVNVLNFPLVEVASCAVKKTLEPPLIAKAIVNRLKVTLKKLKVDSNTIFGIVGNGAIGSSVCNFLLSKNFTVILYDKHEDSFRDTINKNFYRVDCVEKVIANASIIFGCTGRDITQGIDVLGMVKKDAVFISCTSEDKEFKSLLKIINRVRIAMDGPLSDITCESDNGSKITVMAGGYPFNFDRKPWNVPAEEIAVTQGLLFGACVQAIFCASKPINDGKTINKSSRQTLDPYIQRYVALHWLSTQPEQGSKYTEVFSDIPWILKNSGGSYDENSVNTKQFSQHFCLEPTRPRAKL